MTVSADPPPPNGATTHVVGAGLAGLACAVRLVGAGRRVALHEAAGHAGGRCRSFFDAALGCSIDNGNHLMLGGNDATMASITRDDRSLAITYAPFARGLAGACSPAAAAWCRRLGQPSPPEADRFQDP